MKDKVVINVFADPMMGMHWEMYPSLRKLAVKLGQQIQLNFVPIELAKNVYDLVDSRVLEKYDKKVALNQYWAKLMEIYLQEEKISGMPILMGSNDKHLFDEKHTNSKNLNLAYLAVTQLKPSVRNDFLYRLQFATVIENEQTTDLEVVASLAAEFGIDRNEFKAVMRDESLAERLDKFQELAQKLQISELPAFTIECQGKVYVVKGIVTYDKWLEILNQVTNSQLKERDLKLDLSSLTKILNQFEMISEVELMKIFNQEDTQILDKLIEYLFRNHHLDYKVHKGIKFLKRLDKL